MNELLVAELFQLAPALLRSRLNKIIYLYAYKKPSPEMQDFKPIIETKEDAELLQMIYEFDTWGPAMLQAVEAELSKRNILPPDVQKRKEEMVAAETEKLKSGKEASVIGLVVGWLTSLGLLGIFIGYHYAFSKTRSKYGTETFYVYNEQSRKNGTAFFYSAILLTSLGIIYRLIVSNGAAV